MDDRKKVKNNNELSLTLNDELFRESHQQNYTWNILSKPNIKHRILIILDSNS